MDNFDSNPVPLPTEPAAEPKQQKQKRKRATQIECQERIENLLQLKANGASDTQLFKFLQSAYALSERQTYRILAEVREAEIALGEQPIRNLYIFLLNRTRQMFRRCVQKDDLQGQIRSNDAELKVIDRLSRELPSQLDPFSAPTSSPFSRKNLKNFSLE